MDYASAGCEAHQVTRAVKYYSCTPLVSALFTTKLVPVIKLAAGLARKAVALAISCGVPMRSVKFWPSAILKKSGLARSIWD